MIRERANIQRRCLDVPSLALFMLTVAFCVVMLVPRTASAVATDLSLEPPTNYNINFEPGVDPNMFMNIDGGANGKCEPYQIYVGVDGSGTCVDDVEERENSDGSVSFNFSLPDDNDEWFKQEVCGMQGVACSANHCREYLNSHESFEGQIKQLKGGPVAGAKVALLPKPPQVSEFVEPEEEEEEEKAGINLNLKPGKKRCSNQRSGMGPILGAADGSGNFSLGMPAGDFDPGCWELKAAQACEVQDMPTRNAMPEREPKKLIALLPGASKEKAQDQKDAANAAGMAAGMTVLEVVPLVSIDSTLVRFEVKSGGLGGTDAAMLALQANPLFQGSQPEQRFRTTAGTAGEDPYAWMNYGAERIGAQRLHELSDGGGVTVAIIDTGVDTSHPELASRIENAVDVSGFGLSADRHGTAIAGIIAAESGNGIGSYGIAPGTTILAIKACEPETKSSVSSRCWTSTLAKALDQALQSNAKIINMSLGGPEDALIGKLLDKAAENGVLVVAAAGNDGPTASPPFPASHPAVMAVTAVDSADRLYSDAVRGEFVDVAAPGVEIAVPSPGETYPAQLTGTSMATAHVAGAAALLLAIEPETPADALRQSLESSAVAAGDATGRGRIDVCAAAGADCPD